MPLPCVGICPVVHGKAAGRQRAAVGEGGLELLVPTLDYRLARESWGINDLRIAVLTTAIAREDHAVRFAG